MLISPAFQFLRNKQLCTEDVVDAETIFGPGCYRVLEFHQWCLFEVASNIIIKQWYRYKRSMWRSRRFQRKLKGRCYTFCHFVWVSPMCHPKVHKHIYDGKATPFFEKKKHAWKLWRKNTIIDNRSHSRSIGIITSHLGLIYLDLWWSLDKPWGRLRRPWNFPAQLQAAPQP